MGIGPQVKGKYKCVVSNKYGKVVSQSKEYGKSHTLEEINLCMG